MSRILSPRSKVAHRGWAPAFALLALLVACSELPANPESRSPFKIIAHRGASAYAPENTVAAFAKAMELGVTDVELDIQLSKDDVVILFHDKSLVEKTGRPGRVRDYDAADLVEMEIGSWFDRRRTGTETQFTGTRLNTLAELFETFGDRLRYHVELKSDDEALARLALEQIVAHQLEHRVQFTSFSFEQAQRARSAAPHIPTGLLVRDAKRLRTDASAPEHAPVLPLQIRLVDRAVAAGFDMVGFPAEDLSRDIVAYAVDRGLEVRAWRILSGADMWRAITLGTDGMTSDWPDRSTRMLRVIREIRETRGQERAARSR
jgi:glycerophosphoryl diester phosphodiesterase